MAVTAKNGNFLSFVGRAVMGNFDVRKKIREAASLFFLCFRALTGIRTVFRGLMTETTVPMTGFAETY